MDGNKQESQKLSPLKQNGEKSSECIESSLESPNLRTASTK